MPAVTTGSKLLSIILGGGGDRTGEMAQKVKALGTKPEDLSLISKLSWWKEGTSSHIYPLTFTFGMHICAVTPALGEAEECKLCGVETLCCGSNENMTSYRFRSQLVVLLPEVVE